MWMSQWLQVECGIHMLGASQTGRKLVLQVPIQGFPSPKNNVHERAGFAVPLGSPTSVLPSARTPKPHVTRVWLNCLPSPPAVAFSGDRHPVRPSYIGLRRSILPVTCWLADNCLLNVQMESESNQKKAFQSFRNLHSASGQHLMEPISTVSARLSSATTLTPFSKWPSLETHERPQGWRVWPRK